MKVIVQKLFPIIIGLMLVFFSSSVYGCSNPGQPPVPGMAIDSPRCVGSAIYFRATFAGTTDNLTHYWDFGDGSYDTLSSPGFQYQTWHTYANSGTYTVILIKKNPFGSDTTTQVIDVRNSPIANFSMNTNNSCLGPPIDFTDLSSPGFGNPINTWSWKFGDPGAISGGTDTIQTPSYTYNQSGRYEVSLTVKNTDGCLSTYIDSITIYQDTSLADFSYSTGCPCTDVSFTNTSTGSANAFTWNFGDGTTDNTTAGSIHTYTDQENYRVSLTGMNTSTGCISTTKYQWLPVCGGAGQKSTKANNRWYFGEGGINFNPITPTFLLDGQNTAPEGVAAVSHPVTGNLLFYTDGITVWDKTHAVMQNGAGFNGGNNTNQDVLIVPYPGDTSKYYLFVKAGLGASTYSIVDMTLNGGNGGVDPSNKLIPWQNTNSSEAMSGIVKTEATCSKNAEYWVAVPDTIIFSAPTSFSINFYLVTSTGISPPVTNGLFFSSTGYANLSTMTFSRNRELFVIANNGGFELFDFDFRTGILTNHRTIKLPVGTSTHGAAFSKDDSKLYIGEYATGKLFQFDMSTPTAAAIEASVYTVSSADKFFYIYTGPDDKIYVTYGYGGNPQLGVINNPNLAGAACNYNHTGFNLGGKQSHRSLQNIVPLYLPNKDTSSFANFTYTISNCTQVDFINADDTCTFAGSHSNYYWDFGDGNTSTQYNPIHLYTTAGTYTVQLAVERPFICASDTIIKTITISSPPTVSIASPAQLNCTNSNITLTGSSIAGVSYQWTGGPATANYTVSTAGTYTLTVTDSTGCFTQQTVVVTGNTASPDISIALPAQLNCANTSETLLGNSSTAGVTYQWTAGPADSLYSVSAAGTYTLTVTDPVNGCDSSQTVTVTQDGSIPNISITPSEITCTNDSVTIQASSSTVGITYQWVGGPADSVYKVGTAGNYTLTATNTISGCTSEQVVYVNSNTTLPNVSIASPTQLNCSITSETLMGSSTTAGVTYQWTGGIGTTTAAYTVNTASTYTLTITNPINGCTSSQSVTVTSNTTPPALTASSSGDITCSNTSSTLTGTSPGNVMIWNGGTLINSPNPSTITAAGTYTVTATDVSTGCTSTASVTVTENTAIPNVSIAPPAELNCDTLSTTLIGNSTTASVTYQWTGGPATATYLVNTAATYTLTVTDPSNGCVSQQTVVVTSNTTPPDISITPPAELNCDTLSTTLIGNSTTASVMYQWTGGPATATYLVNTAATYTLTVTDPSNGCVSQKTIVVTSNTTPPDISIAPPAELNCSTNSITLTGNSTTAGVNYQWTGGAGTSTPTYTISTAATYTLTVTNPSTGCATQQTIVVNSNTTLPDISIAPPTQLTCGNTNDTLRGSSTTAGVSYQWISGPADSLYSISTAGTYTLIITNPNNTCTASQSVTVTQDGSIPNISITPSEITCTNDSVTIQASSSTAGLTYQWTGGPADSVYKVGAAGNYTLTATNTISGCTSVQVVYVNSNTTAPNVSIASPEQLNCTNSNVTLTGNSTTSGVTYQWTGGPGTTIYTVNTSGTYTFTVTDPSNGCTSQQTVVVSNNTSPPDISITPPAQLTCSNTNETLTGNSATAGVTYQWTFGPADSVYTVSTPASYTLIVTNPANTCTASQEVTVTQDGSIPTIIITPSEITCANDSVTILAISNTPGITYQWVGGPADSVYKVGAAGNYTLTATNPVNGCTSTQVVYVNSNTTSPTISIASPSTLTCDTLSTTLIGSSTTSGGTYQWTGGTSTPTYTVNTPATYTLIVTDPNNGCATQQTVVVTSNIAPPTVIVNSDSICTGQTATLTASGANTYTWSTGVSTSSITVTPVISTTYTVTGTNTANGCANIATAVVTIVSPPTAIAAGTTVCEGEIINLTSTGGGTYTWNGPNAFTSTLQNPTLTNSTILNSGTYTVTVSYSSCSATATAMVTVNPTPITNAGNDVSITMGSSTTLTATGGTSYIWTPTTGLDCDTCASVIATPTVTTIYCVQSNIGTCNSSDCITVTVETPCPSNKDLAVPNAFSPNADGHNDDFCLQGWNTCIETFTILIYDRWGEKVFESEEANFSWDGMYKGKVMDPAVFVYYIKATFTNGNEVVKKGNISLIK